MINKIYFIVFYLSVRGGLFPFTLQQLYWRCISKSSLLTIVCQLT